MEERYYLDEVGLNTVYICVNKIYGDDVVKVRYIGEDRSIIPLLAECLINFVDKDDNRIVELLERNKFLVNIHIIIDFLIMSLEKGFDKVISKIIELGISREKLDESKILFYMNRYCSFLYGKRLISKEEKEEKFSKIVKIFIFGGCNPRLKSDFLHNDTLKGSTSFLSFLSITNFSNGAISHLIDLGLDPEEKEENGMTPIDYAVIKLKYDVLDVYSRYGFKLPANKDEIRCPPGKIINMEFKENALLLCRNVERIL